MASGACSNRYRHWPIVLTFSCSCGRLLFPPYQPVSYVRRSSVAKVLFGLFGFIRLEYDVSHLRLLPDALRVLSGCVACLSECSIKCGTPVSIELSNALGTVLGYSPSEQ